MSHESSIVRNRVIHDDVLRERVAALLAKFANYLIALGGGATEEQTAWARYTLADKGIPDQKATMMMWLICWDASVLNTATADITDATLSGIIEPHAIKY